MTDTAFKWTCIKCDKTIPQHQEYCPECEEKRYRKIGGLLFVPFLNMFLIAYGYFTSLAVTLKASIDTLGYLPLPQSTYLFISAGVNFVLLLIATFIIFAMLKWLNKIMKEKGVK